MDTLHERSTLKGAPVDPGTLRETLSHFASGITIVSSADLEGPVGFTCQSFFPVSIDPPLVSISVMNTSTTYPRVRLSGRFAVNVLAHHQDAVSNQFAKSGTDKWAGIDWAPTRSGTPVIADTLMWLDCEIWAEHEAGDHVIVIGQVQEMSPSTWHKHNPLVYFKGQYRHLRDADQSARA